MKRTVKQRVDDFRKNNHKANFAIEEMDEIMGLDSMFDRIMTDFYLGYIKGQKKQKKGGAA